MPSRIFMLFAVSLSTVLFVGGADLVAAEDAPPTCPAVPANPPSEEMAGLVGSWSLTSFDGEKPAQAMVVQFLAEGKAKVTLGDAKAPAEATYGTNCCGHLVLAPVTEGDFSPVVAEFEEADGTLTLFANEGDWVFTRLTATTRAK